MVFFEQIISIDERTSEESSSDECYYEVLSSRIFEEVSISRIFESRDDEETIPRRLCK